LAENLRLQHRDAEAEATLQIALDIDQSNS
jgi:hypothetical protein